MPSAACAVSQQFLLELRLLQIILPRAVPQLGSLDHFRRAAQPQIQLSSQATGDEAAGLNAATLSVIAFISPQTSSADPLDEWGIAPLAAAT